MAFKDIEDLGTKSTPCDIGEVMKIRSILEDHWIKYSLLNDSNKELFERKINNRAQIRELVIECVETIDSDRLEEALGCIKIIYTEMFPNKSSLDVIFSTDVRGIIKKRFGYDSKEHKMAKDIAKITKEEKGILVDIQKTKIYEGYANRIRFAKEEVLSVIKENIASPDPIRRAIALLIMSGCRPIELFLKANFKPNPEQGPNWVWQDYIAKKREKESKEEKGELLTKPIIYLTAVEFIKEVARMRKDLREIHDKFTRENGQLSTSISSKANSLIKEMFKQKEGVVLYTARKLYGDISYEMFSETTDLFGKDVGPGIWLNRTLGHEKNNLAVFISYSGIKVRNS